ncbi:MAG: acyl-CoA dehydrogenase family protein [Nocardioides sp.]|uniref:acyl-CoA dehydrogenase family protein n=1 Tax=Nocardioides sp. TaxID=35761 RepID=UPI0039E63FF4
MSVNAWQTEERKALVQLTADFTKSEILPFADEWERTGMVPLDLHKKAAALGLLGIGVPEEVGGSGGDLIDTLIFHDTMLRAGAPAGTLVALTPHVIALPSVIKHGTSDQIDRFVRPVLAGEKVCALAVTEPSGGSDVGSLRTRGVADGDEWVISGPKTFISSGHRADFVTVAARTSPEGKGAISLFVVETDRPGFTLGRKLEKMGWLSSDTAELHFDDVRVPQDNLIGTVHRGFPQLMVQFQSERLLLAQQCCALGRRALDLTIDWVRQRDTFGAPLASRQVVAHRVAQMWERLEAAEALVRQCALAMVEGDDVATQAAAAKNVAVAAAEWAAYQAVQLFGGMGYMRESEVERIYRDVRLYGIGGGTTEIMREIISRELL